MLRAVTDHIIVRPITDEKTSSGIALVQGEKKPEKGEVLHVGPGRERDDGNRSSMDVKVGETILFPKYAGDELEIDGETVVVISMDDVRAVIE